MRAHLLDLNAGVANRGTPALDGLLRAHGFELKSWEIRLGGSFPPDDAALWVLGGGPGSPLEEGPWRAPLLRVLGGRVAAGRPILGICFGFEMLAAAVGAELRRLKEGREGIHPVALSEAGRGDAVLADLHAAGAYEKRDFGIFGAFAAGSQVEVLAFGPEGDVAAARFGPQVLGVIFHPEADLGPETARVYAAVVPRYLAGLSQVA